MENLQNRIGTRLISNKKQYLNWKSEPSYKSQKIYDNGLVAMRQIKVTLTLNKPAYDRMYVSDTSKVLIGEFHYDYHRYGNN